MKKVLLIVLALCLLVSFPMSVSAGDEPLTLAVSTPEAAAVDVAVDSEIVLEFSNNVVNASVKDNNLNCITMTDDDGNNIDVTLEMADDQIEPDLKRIINVIPDAELQEGMTYHVIISADLMAKNGDTLGEEVTVTFSTVKPSTNWTLYIIIGVVVILIVVIVIAASKKKK